MPELPEAETIVRTLAPHIEGRRLQAVEIRSARAAPEPLPDLAGRTVERVRRYGKQVVWDLDGGLLRFELRMTGLLLWRVEPGPYTRVRLRFCGGAVCFDDIRQFGSLRWSAGELPRLGPDALEIEAADLARRLAGRRARIKPLLTDQRFLRGLGNIYADEILHRARVHPMTPAHRLGEARAARLHAAMREVLTEAIALGGSSISDYVDADGRPGRFQERHRVYGREGVPCPACGARIRRIVVGGRGTWLCPRCQRLPRGVSGRV